MHPTLQNGGHVDVAQSTSGSAVLADDEVFVGAVARGTVGSNCWLNALFCSCKSPGSLMDIYRYWVIWILILSILA